MGNGASSTKRAKPACLEGDEKAEIARLRVVTPALRQELKKKDEILQAKDEVLRALHTQIVDLKREIHQLSSVLEVTYKKKSIAADAPLDNQAGLSSQLSKEAYATVEKARSKRFAVSAESGGTAGLVANLQRFPKDQEAKTLILKGIRENNFLKHLDDAQLKAIVSYMFPCSFKTGEFVIKEGDTGNAMFVVKSGTVQVSKAGALLGGPLGSGVLFGELAILYNCTRTASVRALEDVEVWSIERPVYQSVMLKTGTKQRQEHLIFLKSVQLFSDLQPDKLHKILDVVSEDSYRSGEYIIREGEGGDTFFIILEGEVRVQQMLDGKSEPQEVRKLFRGDYFGEKALLREDVRTASILASSDLVKCLVIEREPFMSFIGGIKQIVDKDYGDEARGALIATRAASSITNPGLIKPEFKDATLDRYEIITTLGTGGFGRVELVRDRLVAEKTYALKSLSKQHVVETKQQEHVQNERSILLSVDCPFIVKLHRSFRDSKYVYLLMDACLGGELWTILRDRDSFDENTARFYVACAVEALDYLHARGIVYRDLKPENVLMDSTGYVKLVDFGFAKKIGAGKKTWTFCGTPEYVAPEVILNKGHDMAVDYWSLGVLMFELLTGNPPFASKDAMSTYHIILKGIDALEFPDLVTKSAQNLIKKLCRDVPSERLGNQKDGLCDVRKHKWFQGFHWSGLSSRTLKPPFIPNVTSPSDCSNFDIFADSTDVPPDELSGWDCDF